MINIKIENNELKVTGEINLGYIGVYKDSKIEFVDSLEEIREWEIVSDNLDVEEFTNEEIVAFLTDYYNAYIKKITDNIKKINDVFLLKTFIDMQECEIEFWSIDELVIEEKMPEDCEDIYDPYWEFMSKLEEDCGETPNDGSVQKIDIEAVLRKNYPMFNFEKFINNIIPEVVTLIDGGLTFQCSDNFGYDILCGAYDRLDENLCFTDWHNF